jgi:hypothetical protein
MQIHIQIDPFIRNWFVTVNKIVVGTAILFAPFCVFLNEVESWNASGLLKLHLLFMLALWFSLYVAWRARNRNGIEPTGWENLCAGFAVGGSAIYSLSFLPLINAGTCYCWEFVSRPISIPLEHSSLPEAAFAVLLIVVALTPFLSPIAGASLSPVILPARTILLAWQIRRRMPKPSNLLPAGVGLAFVFITAINGPLSGAELTRRLVTSEDKRVAFFAQRLLMVSAEYNLGIPTPYVSSDLILGRPFYLSR